MEQRGDKKGERDNKTRPGWDCKIVVNLSLKRFRIESQTFL
jgi:hypothetical protein